MGLWRHLEANPNRKCRQAPQALSATGAKRHRHQASQAQSAAGAKRRRRQAPQAPSAAGTKRRRRQAPQAQSAAGAKRRRRQAPQAPSVTGTKRRRRQAPRHGSRQEARGPSAARVTSAHPQGSIYLFDHPEGKATVKCVCVYVSGWVSPGSRPCAGVYGCLCVCLRVCGVHPSGKRRG